MNGTFAARLYGAEAARLIHAHPALEARPFFLYCAFTVVHSPNQAPPESIARYHRTVPSPARRLFGGMVWDSPGRVCH
jgi:hypothetical protein